MEGKIVKLVAFTKEEKDKIFNALDMETMMEVCNAYTDFPSGFLPMIELKKENVAAIIQQLEAMNVVTLENKKGFLELLINEIETMEEPSYVCFNQMLFYQGDKLKDVAKHYLYSFSDDGNNHYAIKYETISDEMIENFIKEAIPYQVIKACDIDEFYDYLMDIEAHRENQSIIAEYTFTKESILRDLEVELIDLPEEESQYNKKERQLVNWLDSIGVRLKLMHNIFPCELV